jgi:hypothetical protein
VNLRHELAKGEAMPMHMDECAIEEDEAMKETVTMGISHPL